MDISGLSVDQISDEYFFDHVLPPIQKVIDIERICDRLKRRFVFKELRKGRYGWIDLNKTKKRSKNNTAILKGPLTDVLNAMINGPNDISSELSSSILELETDGNRLDLSEYFQLDGALLLSNATEKDKSRRCWYDVAIPISFSKDNTDSRYDDMEQLVNCMHHIMAYDPCRRLIYGLHMTDTTIQVCFLSRRSILSSSIFDLNKDHRSVVKILLSLLYASNSDLGWDPTISVDLVEGERNYMIDISGTLVSTNESLSLSRQRAEWVIGSGTRVYKAHKIINGKKAGMVVLKDYWLSDGQTPEPDIRDMILNDITDLDDRDYVDKHVLSCLAYGQVKVDDVVDHTERVILHNKSPEVADVGKNASVNNGAQEGINSTFKNSMVHEDDQKESYSHRTHYRILYNEVAIPFYELTNSKDILLVLIDVIETLLRIHKAGWVHRDISTGNIYLYVDPVTGEKRGMLGDLEFAKKVDTGARYDVRTGTLDFMAIEVAAGNYLFTEKKKKSEDDILSRLYSYVNEPTSSVSQIAVGSGICNNYIHDLESVWWIAAWALFSFEKKMPLGDDVLDPMASSTRRKNKQTLFPGVLSSTHRGHFFSIEGVFVASVKGCIPQYFSRLVHTLRASRQEIMNTYEREEADNPTVITFKENDDSEGACLHKALLTALRETEKYMEDFEIVLVPSSDSRSLSKDRVVVCQNDKSLTGYKHQQTIAHSRGKTC